MAALLVAIVGIRHAFFFALIPGLFAAVAISVAAASAPRVVAVAGERARLELRNLRRTGLFRPLLPVAAFELGNVTTMLLILRVTQLLHHGVRSLTAAASLAILLYAGHNVVAAGTSLLGGGWIDRGGPQRGPRRVFVAGAATYIAAYGGFAFGIHAWPLLLLLFCLAGAGIGLAETAESTLVAHLLPRSAAGQRVRAARWAAVGGGLPVVGGGRAAVRGGVSHGRLRLCRGLDDAIGDGLGAAAGACTPGSSLTQTDAGRSPAERQARPRSGRSIWAGPRTTADQRPSRPSSRPQPPVGRGPTVQAPRGPPAGG